MSPSFSTPPAGPRVRFAPSPTGYLHVGGARTALFNWLFARHHGGTLVLRIEDTDIERSTAEMVEGILQGMRWLGLDWDEGPFHQTERMELYRESAAKLLGLRTCLLLFLHQGGTGSASRVAPLLKAARPVTKAPAGRFLARKAPSVAPRENPQPFASPCPRPAAPLSTTPSSDAWNFLILELEDFVLLRSDGGPTYHLSVVTDDVDMRISHIIRGADHISNTPKQVLLYQALGAALPVFAHVPLILGPDKTRLSKRHGATSVIAYRDEGIVPEAFRNFLALLGWTPPASVGDGTVAEILGDQQLIQLFDLNGISHSNAVFDRAKLDWFNTEYIRAYPAERLLPLIQEEWQKAGLEPTRSDPDWLLATINLLKPRARA